MYFNNVLQQTFGQIKTDVIDTLDNFTLVHDCLTKLVSDAAEVTRSIDLDTSFLPISITALDQQFIIKQTDFMSSDVGIYKYNSDGYELLHQFITWNNDENRYDVNWNDENNFSVRQMLDSFNTGFINCSILNEAISACDATNPVQHFMSVASSKFSQATGDAEATLQDIISMTASPENFKSSIMDYFSRVYSALSLATADDSTSTYSFNDTEYYVEGFFGQAAIKAVAQVASTVLSGVLAVINPIVGMAAYLVSTGIMKIVNLFADYGSISCKINESAESNLFAQRVFHKENVTLDSTLVYYISRTMSYSGRYDTLDWNTGLSRTIYLLDRYGFAALYTPNVLFIFYKQNDGKYTIEGYLRVSPERRVYDYFATPANFGSNSSYIYELFNTPCVSNISVGYSAITLTDMSLASPYDNTVYNIEPVYPFTDFSYRLAVMVSLAHMLQYAYGGAELSASATMNDYSSIASLISNTMSISSMATIILALRNYHNYKGNSFTVINVDQLITWENIVNNYIPSVEKLINDQFSRLLNNLTTCLQNLNNVFPSNVNENTNYKNRAYIGIAIAPTEQSIICTPPSVSIGAYIATGLALAAIAAATVVVAVGAFKIRRAIQLRQQRKLINIDAKKYEYEEKYRSGASKQELDALWTDYTSAIRKYNITAPLWGSTRLNYYDGQSVSSTSSYAQSSDGYNQGLNIFNSIDAYPKIYKAITGSDLN